MILNCILLLCDLFVARVRHPPTTPMPPFAPYISYLMSSRRRRSANVWGSASGAQIQFKFLFALLSAKLMTAYMKVHTRARAHTHTCINEYAHTCKMHTKHLRAAVAAPLCRYVHLCTYATYPCTIFCASRDVPPSHWPRRPHDGSLS